MPMTIRCKYCEHFRDYKERMYGNRRFPYRWFFCPINGKNMTIEREYKTVKCQYFEYAKLPQVIPDCVVPVQEFRRLEVQ